MRIGMILNIPRPKIENEITVTMATSATGQFVVQLLTATGARTSPMPMMIGPVTTGGKNFMTVLTPQALTKPDTMKYMSDEEATPRQAYWSITVLEQSSYPGVPAIPDRAKYPAR